MAITARPDGIPACASFRSPRHAAGNDEDDPADHSTAIELAALTLDWPRTAFPFSFPKPSY